MNNLPHLWDTGRLVPETCKAWWAEQCSRGKFSCKGMTYCRNTCFFGGGEGADERCFVSVFLAPFQMKPQVQETKEPNGVIRNGTENPNSTI